MDPLTLAGIGAGASLLGGLFGTDLSFEDAFNQQLRGIGELGELPSFGRTAAPGQVSFERFGEGQIRQAESLLQPQLELALANSQRQLGAGLGGVGAATAAGGLSPAAAATLANQVRFGAGQERAGIRAGFAGQTAGLAGNIFSGNLAAAEAEQASEFGLFDRLFGQEQFAATFGRQTALDQFQSELQRRQLAAGLAGQQIEGTPGNFFDTLGGIGEGLLGGGLQMVGQQYSLEQLLKLLG